MEQKENVAFDCMVWAVTVCGILAAAISMTGCEFAVRTQYWGRTGIDHRDASQLVAADDGDEAEVRKASAHRKY